MPSNNRPSARPGRPPRKSHNSGPRTAAPLSDLERKFLAAGADNDATLPTSFAELGLPEKLITALNRRGITTAFPIQAKTLPDALAGRDVLGRAQTGSGKTLAFGLPALARLSESTPTAGVPRALVLVPTRELAKQVHDSLEPLAHALNMRLCAVYGGASMYRQVQALRRGVDLVVATPGRLLDLMNQGECNLGSIEVTVLDEADFMADLGFLPDVKRILTATPAGGQRMLFSATLDKGVDSLVREYLNEAVVHSVAPVTSPVEAMDHRAFVVQREDKVPVLREITSRPARTLVFVRTKHGADRLAKQLRAAGGDAAAIHGDMTQGSRQRALSDFTTGRCRVLVATDVAARGIHVDDLDLVVHYDPPADSKDYLHRSGRTARAGASGVVLSLVLPDQRRTASQLFTQAGVRVEQETVSSSSEEVRRLATSGEAVVVTAEPEPQERQSAERSRGRGSWQGNRSGSRRPGGPGGRPRRDPAPA